MASNLFSAINPFGEMNMTMQDDMMPGLNVGMDASVGEDVERAGGSNVLINTDMNPFASVNMEMGNAAPVERGITRVPNQHMSSGQYLTSKNSQLAQLADPTGKAMTAQTIIIDNLIKSVKVCEEMSKTWDKRMDELTVVAKHMLDKLDKDELEIEEIKSFMDTYKDMYTKRLTDLDEFVAQVEALPAVIEGDRGIYEHDIQPSAPIMRRNDNTPMRDVIMVPEGSGMPVARRGPMVFDKPESPAPSKSVSESMSMAGTTNMIINHHMDLSMDPDLYDGASVDIVSSLERLMKKSGSPDMFDRLIDMKYEGEDMIDVLITFILTDMVLGEREAVNMPLCTLLVENIAEMKGSDLDEFMSMIGDSLKSRAKFVSMVEVLN
jgi:hypothetical protein